MARTVILVMAAFAGGCSLNLGGGDSDDDVPPDLRCDYAVATCEDGVVTFSETPGENDCPAYRNPRVVATCPGDCTTDIDGYCFVPPCTPRPPVEMCVDPPATPLPPVLGCDDTSCTGDGVAVCGALDICGAPLAVGECTCASGTRECELACADGLCGAAAVQAALVGTWTGTMTSGWATYDVMLTFSPDGHYFAVKPGGDPVFYYGTDGGGDARRFHVIAQTELGATALVRVFFYPGDVVDGLARAIRFDRPDHVTFDFVDAWLSCTRHFYYDLTRQP